MEKFMSFFGIENKENVECKAQYDGEINKENPAFDEKDDGYSNQGPGSTCTRQALAKCAKFRFKHFFGDMHPLDLKSILQSLISAVPKGSSRSSPRNYDGLKGQILSQNGYVYEL